MVLPEFVEQLWSSLRGWGPAGHPTHRTWLGCGCIYNFISIEHQAIVNIVVLLEYDSPATLTLTVQQGLLLEFESSAGKPP